MNREQIERAKVEAENERERQKYAARNSPAAREQRRAESEARSSTVPAVAPASEEKKTGSGPKFTRTKEER